MKIFFFFFSFLGRKDGDAFLSFLFSFPSVEMSDEQRNNMASEFNSIYLNDQSMDCALISCGSLLSLLEKVVYGDLRNGFAIIRPPGHHAVHDCVSLQFGEPSFSLW